MTAHGVRAGDLNRLVTISRRVSGTRDAGGAPIVTYTEQSAIWAKRTDISDGERLRAQGVAATNRARFLVRTEDAEGVTALDRIRDDDAGETFDVTNVKRVSFEALEITAGSQADG